MPGRAAVEITESCKTESGKTESCKTESDNSILATGRILATG